MVLTVKREECSTVDETGAKISEEEARAKLSGLLRKYADERDHAGAISTVWYYSLLLVGFALAVWAASLTALVSDGLDLETPILFGVYFIAMVFFRYPMLRTREEVATIKALIELIDCGRVTDCLGKMEAIEATAVTDSRGETRITLGEGSQDAR